VSRETVRNYVEAGRLPFREERTGLRRYYYFRPEDVERLAKELKPESINQ